MCQNHSDWIDRILAEVRSWCSSGVRAKRQALPSKPDDGDEYPADDDQAGDQHEASVHFPDLLPQGAIGLVDAPIGFVDAPVQLVDTRGQQAVGLIDAPMSAPVWLGW